MKKRSDSRKNNTIRMQNNQQKSFHQINDLWHINLHGIDYPVRSLDIPNWGHCNVSVESLGDKIAVDVERGSYADAVQWVDEKVFYFVSDDEIRLSDEKLMNLILKELL